MLSKTVIKAKPDINILVRLNTGSNVLHLIMCTREIEREAFDTFDFISHSRVQQKCVDCNKSHVSSKPVGNGSAVSSSMKTHDCCCWTANTWIRNELTLTCNSTLPSPYCTLPGNTGCRHPPTVDRRWASVSKSVEKPTKTQVPLRILLFCTFLTETCP